MEDKISIWDKPQSELTLRDSAKAVGVVYGAMAAIGVLWVGAVVVKDKVQTARLRRKIAKQDEES